MRLPTSKVYRAFPELDRFSDDQCEAYVRRAEREAGWLGTAWMVAMWSLAAFAALAILFGGMYLSLVVLKAGHRDELPIAHMSVLATLMAGVPGAIVLLSRDWWLRRSIARSIAGARCGGCRYSLLGLDARDGEVVCPECGLRIDLMAYGLTPEHLIGSPATQTGA